MLFRRQYCLPLWVIHACVNSTQWHPAALAGTAEHKHAITPMKTTTDSFQTKMYDKSETSTL